MPFTSHVPIGFGNVLSIADIVTTVNAFHDTHRVIVVDVDSLSTISEKV